jgi:peptidoglycan/xylan/chitin deacetylase (PgdA/CDA1 family)
MLAITGIVLIAQNFLQIENRTNEQKELPPEIVRAIRMSEVSRNLKVPIFIYHYVEFVKDHRDTIRKSLDTEPHIFEAQVRTVSEAGYTFLTAGELADIIDTKLDLPEKSVILTFDDGYRDFYTDVFPVLKKFRAKATVYVIPSFLDTENYLTSRQIAEMLGSGLVEVGAHTVHHVQLKGKPEPLVSYEISESRRMLEERFGIRVISFAYPFGSFDRQTVDLVRDSGFRTAVTTVEGIDAGVANRFFLYRVRAGTLTGDPLLRFIRKWETGQVYDP